MLYISIRERQASLIEQNKASIVITRITRTAADGGWTEATSTLASQDVRIYFKKSRTLIINEGGYHSERVTKMIMKWDASVLPESATNLDKFTYGGKTYKVYDVKDVYTQGYIIFKECSIIEL
jgi:hypothetical protein